MGGFSVKLSSFTGSDCQSMVGRGVPCLYVFFKMTVFNFYQYILLNENLWSWVIIGNTVLALLLFKEFTYMGS